MSTFLPSYEKTAYSCPHCGAFSRQYWMNFYYGTSRFSNSNEELESLKISVCEHCSDYALWHKEKMIYPEHIKIGPVNSDLPDEIKQDYHEASKIFRMSPRGSSAILRLAIQKLCIHLGEKGKDLNRDIANLVERGLPRRVQKALDVVRVTGNKAVHPGVLNKKDNNESAAKLFKLVNFISEKMITEPKEVDKLFDTLTKGSREQIDKRDKNRGRDETK